MKTKLKYLGKKDAERKSEKEKKLTMITKRVVSEENKKDKSPTEIIRIGVSMTRADWVKAKVLGKMYNRSLSNLVVSLIKKEINREISE